MRKTHVVDSVQTETHVMCVHFLSPFTFAFELQFQLKIKIFTFLETVGSLFDCIQCAVSTFIIT